MPSTAAGGVPPRQTIKKEQRLGEPSNVRTTQVWNATTRPAAPVDGILMWHRDDWTSSFAKEKSMVWYCRSDFPCKDCEKRYPGCHGTCPEYLAVKKQHDERKAIADKEKYTQQNLYLHKAACMEKIMRHRKPCGRSTKRRSDG